MARSGFRALILATLFVGLLSSAAFAQKALPYTDHNPVVTDVLTGQVMDSFFEADLGEQATLSAYLADARRGIVHLDVNADKAVTPASLMKLVTTGAALDVLGPDYRFETTVELDGSIEGGALYGDILIVGGGDPSLGPRLSDDPDDVTKVVREWAKALREAGVRSVVGNVIGDGRRYEDDPVALGWEPLERGEWYSAEVSGLNYNDNVVDVLWKADKGPGRLASYDLRPDTDYVVMTGSVRIVRNGREPEIRYYRFADSNEIRARGRIPAGARFYDFAAIHDPARYTAYLLMEELRRRKIDVGGAALSGHDFLRGDFPTTGTTVVATDTSPPLSDLLPVANTDSVNLYAETMLRETALSLGYPASFREGGRAATDWLIEEGLHRTGFLMVDGSGLSTVNKGTARLFGGLLMAMQKSPHGDLFRESLAKPGGGSLKNRFQEERFVPLADDLSAKTGYLAGTHGLAGYIRNHRGTPYVFTFIVSDYEPGKSREARDFIDDLVLKIHQTEVLP